MNTLELADLEPRLTYPDGDTSSAVQLEIFDRRSSLVVARFEMTQADLVNFLAGRRLGSLEGVTSLLNERDRTALNKQRTLVSAQLPFAVEVFEDDDSRNLDAWAADAVRAWSAHDFRVSRGRSWITVSLVFFHAEKTAADEQYLIAVRERFGEVAQAYGERAVAHEARFREISRAAKR